MAQKTQWNAGQVADSKPGPYFVTAQKSGGSTYWVMRGPFETHQAALDAVTETMNKAVDLDARAHWMEWGTARMVPGTAPGKMNGYFEAQS